MKNHILKIVRVVAALLFFLPILFFFCDFAGVFPDAFSHLLRMQVVPAILSGSIVALITLFLLTLLFGRIYCSVICPMGVFQDVITWFTKRGKKKNKKKRWFRYNTPYNILRYSLLAICIGFFIFGITTPLLFLDPYSNFGRIGANLFRPLIMEGNNQLNWIAMEFNNYSFYHVSIYTVTLLSFTISLIALLIVGVMSFLRGRLFCNTICPVGSLLGLISRFAIFRVVLDQSACTSCAACEKACKSQCIDSKRKTVDSSRCVSCFNCLDRCNQKGIKYKFAYSRANYSFETKSVEKDIITSDVNSAMNRRNFIVTSTAIATSLPLIPVWAQTKEVDVTKLTPITPPGSKGLKHFKEKCTACHLCVTHCPQQILKPAGFEFGINYAFKPHMVFYEKGFCNFKCTVCSEICPNGAIEKLTKEEKIVTQVGIAKFDENLCIVITESTACGACSEHCPIQAVKMKPYEGGLTLPHIYEELCIGCGGCESICPVRPIKAINVLSKEVHGKALRPQEEEVEEINSEELDFGF